VRETQGRHRERTFPYKTSPVVAALRHSCNADLDEPQQAEHDTFPRDLAGFVAVLDGYGLSIRVDANRLAISDDIADQTPDAPASAA